MMAEKWLKGWSACCVHPIMPISGPRDAQKILTVAQVFVIYAVPPGDRSRDRREPRSEI